MKIQSQKPNANVRLCKEMVTEKNSKSLLVNVSKAAICKDAIAKFIFAAIFACTHKVTSIRGFQVGTFHAAGGFKCQ
jgi:hypothetical protein